MQRSPSGFPELLTRRFRGLSVGSPRGSRGAEQPCPCSERSRVEAGARLCFRGVSLLPGCAVLKAPAR